MKMSLLTCTWEQNCVPPPPKPMVPAQPSSSCVSIDHSLCKKKCARVRTAAIHRTYSATRTNDNGLWITLINFMNDDDRSGPPAVS